MPPPDCIKRKNYSFEKPRNQTLKQTLKQVKWANPANCSNTLKSNTALQIARYCCCMFQFSIIKESYQNACGDMGPVCYNSSRRVIPSLGFEEQLETSFKLNGFSTKSLKVQSICRYNLKNKWWQCFWFWKDNTSAAKAARTRSGTLRRNGIWFGLNWMSFPSRLESNDFYLLMRISLAAVSLLVPVWILRVMHYRKAPFFSVHRLKYATSRVLCPTIQQVKLSHGRKGP